MMIMITELTKLLVFYNLSQITHTNLDVQQLFVII